MALFLRRTRSRKAVPTLPRTRAIRPSLSLTQSPFAIDLGLLRRRAIERLAIPPPSRRRRSVQSTIRLSPAAPRRNHVRARTRGATIPAARHRNADRPLSIPRERKIAGVDAGGRLEHFRRLSPRRRSTRDIVVVETPVSWAICASVQRWRRNIAMRAIVSAGSVAGPGGTERTDRARPPRLLP